MTPSREVNGSKRAAKLQALLRRIRDELRAIEDRKELKKAQAQVGKCYRYRNSYSSPQAPSDYWFFYVRVIATQKDSPRFVVVHEFQTDQHGKFESSVTTRLCEFNDGYQPISREEFNRAFIRQHELVSMHPEQIRVLPC